jgi:MOSC domain-containing protein YiiM
MSGGHVEEILIAAVAVRLPRSVARVRAVAGRGLEGDRYFSRSGTWSGYPVQTGTDLTLIEAEVLEALGLSGAVARRNIVTRDIRLNELVGRRFRIGEIECYGDRLCEPCSHLARLSGQSVAVLVHPGGLRADILTGGEIAAGDSVTPQLAQQQSHTTSASAIVGWSSSTATERRA